MSRNGAIRVDMAPAVLARLRELLLRAEARGDGPAALSAARTINRRLHTQPREFGEPLYRLAHLGLMLRVAAVRPLTVYFAVHDTEPLVLVQRFELLLRAEQDAGE